MNPSLTVNGFGVDGGAHPIDPIDPINPINPINPIDVIDVIDVINRIDATVKARREGMGDAGSRSGATKGGARWIGGRC